jgi:hypothetical protein
MAVTRAEHGTGVVYDLEGTILQACSCLTLCPYWLGQDGDGMPCHRFIAWQFDRGIITGIDVSGLRVAAVHHIPGDSPTRKRQKLVWFVDEAATDEQLQAVLAAYSGELGGPLADLAGQAVEIVAIERAPISTSVVDGHGAVQVGSAVQAWIHPSTGPDGTTTTKASLFRVDLPQYGMSWRFERRNAIHSAWHSTHPEQPTTDTSTVEGGAMTGISRQDAPVAIEGDGVELRMREIGGDLTTAFVRLPKGADLRPALAGLPGDLCPCPHWGYLLKGRLKMWTKDGEHVYEAGHAFYWAPGHAPEALEDCEYVDFSPTQQFNDVINHIKSQPN